MKTSLLIITSACFASANAQMVSDAPKGVPHSKYEQLGIHKIAQIVGTAVDIHAADPVLATNLAAHTALGGTPKPALKFFVTNWVAHNLGGPQRAGIPGMPDAGQIPKSWDLTKAQRIAFQDDISQAAMKSGLDRMESKWMADAVWTWIEKSKMTKGMDSGELFKDKNSLYARLGGSVPLAVVVDEFVNQLTQDPTIGANPHTVKALSDGHISTDGLKFLVTEQLAAASGGPFKYTGRSMKNSHSHLLISSKEWEAGGKILKGVLDKFMVPAKEQGEIFTAIASLEKDIVKGG